MKILGLTILIQGLDWMRYIKIIRKRRLKCLKQIKEMPAEKK